MQKKDLNKNRKVQKIVYPVARLWMRTLKQFFM